MNLALIDTDILSEVLKQQNPAVLQNAANYLSEHGQFAVSAITRYEILRGLKSKQARRQLNRFHAFCVNTRIFPVSDAVLDRASDLWAEARRGGHPGRDPDLIIAATAIETSRVLITGNMAHFSWIPTLTIENWR
jgi:tRNA(fMet)-specific endonuclease VapC